MYKRQAKIRWSPDGGWTGITDEDRTAWRTAYPLVDLAAELAKMDAWLRVNKPKKQHGRFAVNWLSRAQQDLHEKSGSGRRKLSADELEARTKADLARQRGGKT